MNRRLLFRALFSDTLACLIAAPHLRAQAGDGLPAAASRARDILRQGVAAKDPAARVEVAVALSLIATRDPAADLLADLARDGDYLVRVAALGTIGELKDTRRLGVLKEALKDDVPEVVFAAARTLLRLKQPEGRLVLEEIVEKEAKAKSGFVRSRIRDTWRRMKTPKSALLLAVQQGIGFVPVPGIGEGVSAMTHMLWDPDFSARATALLTLSADRTPEVGRLIERSFLDDDWSMRAAAVQIAAMRRERGWAPHLISLLDDGNRKVHLRAAACCLRLNYTVARAGTAASG